MLSNVRRIDRLVPRSPSDDDGHEARTSYVLPWLHGRMILERHRHIPTVRQRKILPLPRHLGTPIWPPPHLCGFPTFTVNRYPRSLNHRLDIRLLALLRRQHEGGRQRHLDIGKGRVRSSSPCAPTARQLPPACGPCSVPSQAAPAIISSETSTFGYRCPMRFSASLTHPLAVVADVFG